MSVTSAATATERGESGQRPHVAETVHGESRPTVLVVGPLPPPYHGGAVATRYVLGSTLAERFRLVHLDTTDRRGSENIGRLDAVNVMLALRHGIEFIRMLARERPDLVHVPIAQNRLGFLRDALFLVPALLARVPVVVHVHGGGFRDFHDRTDPLTRAIARFVLQRVSRAIVLGERLRASLRGLADDARVSVIPNGIADPVVAIPSARGATPGRGTVDCTVLYLGTLMEAKGFVDVLEAARILSERGITPRFVFAGGFARPADRAMAEQMLAAAPSARIEFAGVVDGGGKNALLRDADIFVFPTRYANEAHPYVVLEAMAAGLPVITTARAAIPETVRDGETGVLVPEADAPALAQAIARLAADATLRHRLGEAGRERYVREYGVEQWAERMASAWRASLMHGPRDGRRAA